MRDLPELTLDFDDTLNKRLDLGHSQGLDPRLLTIIKQFGRFIVVTHRSFEKSVINSVNAINALGEERLPITPRSMESYFIPTFLEAFSKNYPEIECKVCFESTAREGFGVCYTDALLQFEKELLAALLTLNDNIDKIIPTFKYHLKWLITAAEKTVNEKLSAEFSALVELNDRPDFSEFYLRVEAFIEEKRKQIEELAGKLLHEFHAHNKLPSIIAGLVKTHHEKFSDASNVSAVATLIRLQLKQKIVTAYERHFDKNNSFAKANQTKEKQIEYVMRSSNCAEVFHIDDSEKVARLKMEGVRVFLYEPRCVEEHKFVDDPRVHQWFTDFHLALEKKDTAAARKIMLQGQRMAEIEERAEFSAKFAQIVEAIRKNEDILSLNKNYLLYRLFLQRIVLFKDGLGIELLDKDKHSDSMLREDEHFLSFIKSYLELTARKQNELIEYLEKILAFTQRGVMQILKAQFPEIDFDCIKGALLDDLIKFTFIKPEEHAFYENKRDYDSADRRQVNLVKSRFYRKANGSPEEFCAALNKLLQDFSEKYSQVEGLIGAQSYVIPPYGLSGDLVRIIARNLLGSAWFMQLELQQKNWQSELQRTLSREPSQSISSQFHSLMAFSQTCRFFRDATKSMRQELKDCYGFALKKPDHELKLLIIGGEGVGKEALWRRFVHNYYYSDPYGRKGDCDFGERHCNLNEMKVKLGIWYTSSGGIHDRESGRYVQLSSHERYCYYRHYYYRKVQGIIIAYDTTNQSSFEEVNVWAERERYYSRDDIKVILVGTKCDLVDQKAVDFQTAKKYADKKGWSFFEVSSKEKINVNLAFETLASEIIAAQQLQQAALGDESDEAVKKDESTKCCVM